MNKYPLLICILYSSSAVSSDKVDNLFKLSFEEILKIKVVTVSKREESLEDAPGIISVYTADEIQAFGASNLKDVLLRIPNFYLFDSSTFNGTGSTLRAGATQHINNHVLYLVNGRPLRESQNGGRQTDINLLFPVTAIERIEVIRGPGSVLYGSNAFNGTINIITKKSEENFTADLTASVGSHNHKSLQGSTSVNTESGVNLNLHFNILDEEGETITAYDSQINQSSSQLYREGYFIRADGGYKGFNAEIMSSKTELPAISGRFLWPGLGKWSHFRDYLNIGYNHEFNDSWSSTLNYTYNKMELDVHHPSPVTFLSDGYLVELTVNGKINEDTEVVFGAMQDHIRGDLSIRGGEYEDIRNSMYGQVDYRFSFGTKLTAGFQVNKPEDLASHTSPRLALVHSFNNNWSTKALYAEAFRSPFGTEIHFESPFLKGNEELKPETIKTAEWQITYANPKMALSSTLYQSKTDDLIGRSRINNATYFVNTAQEVTYTGIELEGRWSISENIQLQGNASHQHNENDAGIHDFMLASTNMLKLGLSYQTDFGLTASIWNNHLGKTSKIEDLPGSTAQVANPSADSVNLLSLNMEANIGIMFNSAPWNNTNVTLFANNLLDEAVWFPEMGYKSVNTYPQSHARSIYLKLAVDF